MRRRGRGGPAYGAASGSSLPNMIRSLRLGSVSTCVTHSRIMPPVLAVAGDIDVEHAQRRAVDPGGVLPAEVIHVAASPRAIVAAASP